ncbi:MAG: acetyl-CoA carboxylase biotin carboxylase subunit [Pseudomonadaceae bacterium]|nr:acetyl-CoA carboxylase biotin carboxylase subunit [Pseudomonadaceae bacterium]
MFSKILIANRGEIAVRIIRTCREMGIATVAVHSEADENALHVRMADESVCVGPAQANKSYLNIPALMAAAELTDAEAIHPGFGFLSENARFAEIVTKLGFTFIGPSAEHITLMGDKVSALDFARKAGLPCNVGSAGTLAKAEEALEAAEKVGYPVIIKAASGGGGKGMKVAHGPQALRQAFNVAVSEAKSNFGDERVYLEKYMDKARHIEVQVFGDTHGNLAVLGERDCTLQRRHQKVVEETPSSALTEEERTKLFATVKKALAGMGYVGAGTLEFLYQDGQFSFMEMNTRLQVEHTVTEEVLGLDLVAEQIRVAAGEKLSPALTSAKPVGHSIQCRINAEDPATFVPCAGQVENYYAPSGPGVRVDSALFPGAAVPPYYDAMVAKLVVWAPTRQQAIARARRALDEFVITGIKTNIPLHKKLLATKAFATGDYHIHSLEQFIKEGRF